MSEFKCSTGDGTVIVIEAGPDVSISIGDLEGEMLCAEPDTADAIASAIHVAAAQVRQARGEVIGRSDVEVSDVRGDGVLVRQRSDWTCAAFVSRADVPRLIAELGAWLAAHPEVAK